MGDKKDHIEDFHAAYRQISSHPKFDWILYKLHKTKEWKQDGGGKGLNSREKFDKEFNTLNSLVGSDFKDWKNKLSSKLDLDLNSEKSEYERRDEKNSKLISTH